MVQMLQVMNIPLNFISQHKKWAEQLQASTAEDHLRRGRPDLAEVAALKKIQEATDLAINRKKLVPGSKECDTFLVEYVVRLGDQLFKKHVGIIACVHALTYDTSRNLIRSAMPDPDACDVFFRYRASAYLQTILLAHKAAKSIIPEPLFYAAKDLFKIMHQEKEHFPSVKYLLRMLGHDVVEELLPTEFVLKVVEEYEYKTRLEAELARLSARGEWADAWRLVRVLKDLRGRDGAQEFLPSIIPNHQAWMTWDPNMDRIDLWNTCLTSKRQRTQLASLLALEGPDTSTQGLPIRRQNPQGVQSLGFPSETWSALDEALDLLDHSIAIGGSAVDLFIYFIPPRSSMDSRQLDQVRACLNVTYDNERKKSAAAELVAFHQVIAEKSNDLYRMDTFTAALPHFRAYPTLQEAFGVATMDFASRVSSTLSSVQKEFCSYIQEHNFQQASHLSERICAFARVLRDGEWVSQYWDSRYTDLISQVPSQTELQGLLRGLESAEGDIRQWHMDQLATRVGFSPRTRPPADAVSPASTASPTSPRDDFLSSPAPSLLSSSSSPSIPTAAAAADATPCPPQPSPPKPQPQPQPQSDTIWDLDLGHDHTLFRDQVLVPLRATAPDLASACLRQARREPRSLVCRLLALLPGGGGDGDMVCVNVAAFLGPRTAATASTASSSPSSPTSPLLPSPLPSPARRVHDVWLALLLHLMRARPRGLLDRCAAALPGRQWAAWVRNLRALYGAAFLDPDGGLGITEDAIRAWDARLRARRGVGRSVSARTHATAATDLSDASGLSVDTTRSALTAYSNISSPSVE